MTVYIERVWGWGRGVGLDYFWRFGTLHVVDREKCTWYSAYDLALKIN